MDARADATGSTTFTEFVVAMVVFKLDGSFGLLEAEEVWIEDVNKVLLVCFQSNVPCFVVVDIPAQDVNVISSGALRGETCLLVSFFY